MQIRVQGYVSDKRCSVLELLFQQLNTTDSGLVTIKALLLVA